MDNTDDFSNKLPDENEPYKGLGLKNTLHGVAYQWKILMLLVQRCKEYSFRLASENVDAEKFDDAVLLYKKLEGPINYIFVQAKHIQEEIAAKRKIKEGDLLTDKDELFSLQKYFNSYQRIQQKYNLDNNSRKCFIIYTNIGFKFDPKPISTDTEMKLASLSFKEATVSNTELDLLGIPSNGHNYQLDYSKQEIVRQLKKIFEGTSDCQKLIVNLVACILNGTDIGLTPLMKYYYRFLKEYVFDFKDNKFNDKFMTSDICSDPLKYDDFLKKLFEEIMTQLRKISSEKNTEQHRILFTEVQKIYLLIKSKEKPSDQQLSDLRSAITKFKPKFSDSFNKINIPKPDPKLADPETIVLEIINQIKTRNDNVITIFRGEIRNNIITSFLDDLVGHVFVSAIDENKKETIVFSKNFLSDDTGDINALPEDIKRLRENLIGEFTKIKSRVYSLEEYIFKIRDYNPCQEDELEAWLNEKISIPKPVTEEDVKKFLEYLIFMVNQNNERELSDLISEEFRNEYDLINVDIITSHFQERMIKWLKTKKGYYFTEETKEKFFKDMKSNISNIIMIGPTSEYIKKLTAYQIRYKNPNDTLSKFLAKEINKQIFNYITPKGDTILGSIEVTQILSKYKQHDSFIFVPLKRFTRLQDDIILAKANLLIIECNLENSTEDLYHALCKILNNKDLRLLLISPHDDIFVNKLREDINLRKEIKNVKFKFKFNNLTEGSQGKILEKQVIFQRTKVPLNSIICKDDTNVIKLLPFAHLITDEEVRIGEPLPTLHKYDRDLYINRKLEQYITINRNIFQDKKNKVFTDILTTTDQEFKDLSRNFSEENVHLLQQDDDQFLWQKTHGEITNLLKYVSFTAPTQIYPTETLENIEELVQQAIKQKVMIIADIAGMGKSVLLTYLSEKIKDNSPSHWVGKIDLNEHTGILKRDESLRFHSTQAAIEFVVTDLLKIDKELDSGIFHCLLKNQKVTLMIDAFDEISPYYKETVISLLRALKQYPIEQLWITTRSHLRENLENELQQIAYNITDFTPADQVDFLFNFWKKSIASINEDTESKIINFATELVKKLASAINDNEKKFMGVALQAKIFAEVFYTDFKKYYYDLKSLKLPPKLNLLDIFDKFLNRKYLNYVTKLNSEELDPERNDLIQILKGGVNLRKVHQQLALNVLLPEHEQMLLGNRKLHSLPNESLSTIGIAQVIDHPHFIHRTFAEYYIADFITDLLKKERQTIEIQNFILKDVLFLDNYKVTRSFINNFLEKTVLSEETLKQYGERIKEFDNSLRQPLLPWQTFQRVEHIAPCLSVIKEEEETITNTWGEENAYCTGNDGSILHQSVQENNPYITLFILDALKDKKFHNEVKKLLLHEDYEKQTIWYGPVLNGDATMLTKLWGIAKDVELDRKELFLAEDRNGISLWHWAMRSKEIEVLNNLWKWAHDIGIDLKTQLLLRKDRYNRTAFCWAAQYSNVPVFKRLCDLTKEQGCAGDVLLHKDDIGNIWYWAAQNKNIKIFKILWKWDQEYTNKVFSLCQYDSICLPTVSMSDILCAWHAAAENGNVKILKYFRKFTKRTFGKKCPNPETIWILAAENNRTNVLDYIFSCKDVINTVMVTKDEEDNTAFIIAAKNGFANLLEHQWKLAESEHLQDVLLKTKDDSGCNALAIAASNGHVKLLVKIWEWAEEFDLQQNLLSNTEDCSQNVWFLATYNNNRIEIITKLEEWTKGFAPGEHASILSLKGKYAKGPTVWYGAIIHMDIELLDLLWNWSNKIEDPDLKAPLLFLPNDCYHSRTNRSVWHAAFGYEHPTAMIKKLLSFCIEAKLTADEFSNIWLTGDNNNKTPLDIWYDSFFDLRHKHEAEHILNLIVSYCKTINDGSLNLLLNHLCYFAIQNSDIDQVNRYLNEDTDTKHVYKGRDLLYTAACQHKSNIVVTLLNHGASIKYIDFVYSDSLMKYIQGGNYNKKVKEQLLDKINQYLKSRPADDPYRTPIIENF